MSKGSPDFQSNPLCYGYGRSIKSYGKLIAKGLVFDVQIIGWMELDLVTYTGVIALRTA